MGVDTRRPLLPAPTESIVDTTGGSVTGTDLATDISRRTDKSSYSIPDDGSPITITTRRRSQKREGDDSKVTHTSRDSQTSLLIEYFEASKGSGALSSRPSVRVKVTPSAVRKLRDNQPDHIQISETGGRKPSYTRRISLSTPTKHRQLGDTAADDRSISSDEQNTTSRRPPLEIEFVDRDQASELSTDRYVQPASEISTMPPDSMLDSSLASAPRRKRSQSLERAAPLEGTAALEESADLLKAPSRRRSRSLSRERIAYKVAQKLNNSGVDLSGSGRKRVEKSRSVSKELLDGAEAKPSKKRAHKHRDEDLTSAESSLLSGSGLSGRHRSGDQYSFRSGTSKSSLNNPKLLETVEDAIRRLILPELKELKKDQKVSANKTRFERDTSAAPSTSREEARRLSKHSSAPEVAKSGVLPTGESKSVREEEPTLSEERSKARRERKRDKGDSTTKDKSYIRKGSLPENRPDITEREELRRQRSKGLRDAAAAGIVGTALTTAALKHHDSKSSLERKERRKKRKSRSRSASIHDSDTELVFQKHNVAPMPMRSDIDSELTRDSLLSQRTEETDTPTPRQAIKMQDVSGNSPRGIGSPSSRTPTRTPLRSRHSRGSDKELREGSHSPLGNAVVDGGMGAIAAAAAANLLGDHPHPHHEYAVPANQRALSPIQSVASDHNEQELVHDEARHVDKYEPQTRELRNQRYSIESLSSAPSTDLARNTRPQGLNLESRSQVLDQQDPNGVMVNHVGAERTRDLPDFAETGYSEGHDDPKIDVKHLTNYTDDSLDAPYLDQVTAGQQLVDGYGANPEYVHTPLAVESAVASLLEPSVIDARSLHSGQRSQADSLNHAPNGSPGVFETTNRSLPGSRGDSPWKQNHPGTGPDEKSFTKRIGASSPPQSVEQSEDDHDETRDLPPVGATRPGEPENQIGEEESDINTNPSIIQGPMGGGHYENRDHWPYNPTPPRAKDEDFSPELRDGAEAAAAGTTGLGVLRADQEDPDQQYKEGPFGMDYNRVEPHHFDGQMFSTPPGIKDEGYNSANNPMSPSIETPDPAKRGLGPLEGGLFDSPAVDEDPFTTTQHQRHLSGFSQGLTSPLYDSATGSGYERIQSKDIIALMDHLHVRDAQRNARDTEILFTLVKSAAEMRTSFEEMKRFIAEQDELIMQANEKQHETTQKVIGGPRPQPAPRAIRPLPTEDAGDDLPAKRRNVFRRALKTLSLKSSNDLTRIEDMLEQLLDEVEALRLTQDGKMLGTPPAFRQASVDADGNADNLYQNDYDTAGQANANPIEEQPSYGMNTARPSALRQNSGTRVSTVPEDDEDAEQFEQDHPQPTEPVTSEPITPRRLPVGNGGFSNETTPRKSEDKARKHKSSTSSSSFFPKISRWSKTTASSVGENIRNSIQGGRKERPYSEASRSGSDLEQMAYNTNDYYDPQGDDRLRSNFSLEEEQQQQQGNRPPSPLVPSQISDNPKYQAHRDSLNLQHPQPRQGPSDRYQSHLETQAQNFASPVSPTSEHWGSNSSLTHANTNANRYSGGGRLTPIDDVGYSETSSAPPRPPKIKDEGPLIPQRPPKVRETEEVRSADRYVSRGGSLSPNLLPPQRKPTGPRPITGSGQYSPGNIKRNRYRGSPNHIEYDD